MTTRFSLLGISIMIGLMASSAFAHANDSPTLNQIELFAQAQKDGLTGNARKTKPVLARPAVPGEIVVSIIPGEGVETRSKPAEQGDMVVRSTCSDGEFTDILVKAEKFPDRYGPAQSDADAEGYRTYKPTGVTMEYFIVSPKTGDFQFVAPWGEPMVAKVGDAIVQTPNDANDTYRIARSAFDCTYEVLKPAAE